MGDFFLKQLMSTMTLCLLACSTNANDAYRCPEKLSVQSSIAKLPAGWQKQESVKDHFLVSISFSDGHPSEYGFLKPKISGKEGEIQIFEYNLLKKDAWLVCNYGNTPVMITKKLLKPYRACKFIHEKKNSEYKAVCQ